MNLTCNVLLSFYLLRTFMRGKSERNFLLASQAQYTNMHTVGFVVTAQLTQFPFVVFLPWFLFPRSIWACRPPTSFSMCTFITGTPGYMAPEMEKTGSASTGSDMYSTGMYLVRTLGPSCCVFLTIQDISFAALLQLFITCRWLHQGVFCPWRLFSY